jgi:DNA-directed RNA polymerase specialized sigma24 family protein
MASPESSSRVDTTRHAAVASATKHVKTLEGMRDPRSRLAAVTTSLQHLRERERSLVAVRDTAIVELATSGVTYADIAGLSGLTRGRVAQLVRSARERIGATRTQSA